MPQIDTLGPPCPVPPGRKFPFNRLTLADMEHRCVRCLRAIPLQEPASWEHGGMLCWKCDGCGDAA